MALRYLPGASGQTQFWHAAMQQLSAYQDQQVIAYPGFAACPQHPQVYDFASLGRYVSAQITAPCVLVAQSMGGIFAVEMARQQPSKIRALVLVATSGGIDLTPFQVADWRDQYQQDWDLPDWFVTARHAVIEPYLSQVQCPVLLLWGDQDPISPVAVGVYLRQQLPNAQLQVIAGGEHDLAQRHAPQVAKFIEKFLAQQL
ncbi:alpha/beta hydrolase [Acinetobacter larvae]|uniref:Alpha/beta hydrolase n=1 Tax=Acinetobacter larvae TaxID=1789224 RepID=A0A1B2M3T2_9GAMM|nr:alpha/beta hydrolase [Acinetobacter larvae]